MSGCAHRGAYELVVGAVVSICACTDSSLALDSLGPDGRPTDAHDAASISLAFPFEIDFGSVTRGQSARATATLQNQGATPVAYATQVAVASFSIVEDSCGGLAQAGGACELRLALTPAFDGLARATLVILAEGRHAGSISLVGTGLRPPTLTAIPELVDFGSVWQGAVPKVRSLSLEARGPNQARTGPLTLRVTGDGFLLGDNDCEGLDLQVDQRCHVTLIFSPMQMGSARGLITLSAPSVPSHTIAAQAEVLPAPTQNLRLHHAFDEGSGTLAKDTSGNGHHGAIRFGAVRQAPLDAKPRWVQGRTGGALEITAPDLASGGRFVALDPQAAHLTISGPDLTICAWVKRLAPDGPTEDEGIVSCLTSDGRLGFSLGLSEGLPAFQVRATRARGPNNVPADNQWHHLCGIATAAQVIVHVDGQEVARAALEGAFGSTQDSPIIGARPGIVVDTVTDFFVGSIDDVRIWSRRLESQELSALFNE